MSKGPIYEAASNGDVEKLKQLLKEKPADVDLAEAWSGWTPLIYAARHGKLEAVQFLVERKATVDASDESSATALTLACRSGHAETAAFLLDNGADINHSQNGMTVMMQAVMSGQLTCVKLLRERKADAALRATGGVYEGRTALEIAQERSARDIVALLSPAVSKQQKVTC